MPPCVVWRGGYGGDLYGRSVGRRACVCVGVRRLWCCTGLRRGCLLLHVVHVRVCVRASARVLCRDAVVSGWLWREFAVEPVWRVYVVELQQVQLQ